MTDSPRDRITQLLLDSRTRDAERRVPEELLGEVYADLERLAANYLRRENVGQTLEPGALVHEAYLRLIHGDTIDWQGRTHFFAVGARAMRRLLIDRARHKGRVKRGGDRLRVTFAEELCWPGGALDAAGLLALHQALDKLRDLDPRQARIVELRFFAGMTSREVAQALDVSQRTVEGHWAHARAWLLKTLQG